MVEATHTSEALFSPRRGSGKGGKLWAGFVVVSNGETVDTGLTKIEGMSEPFFLDADIDATTPIAAYSGVSGGIITFVVKDLDDYTAALDETCSLLVVGWAK